MYHDPQTHPQASGPYQPPLAEAPPVAALPPASPSAAPRLWPVALVVLASIVSFVIGSGIALLIAQFVVTGEIATSREAALQSMELIKRSRLGFSITVILPQIALVLPAVLAAVVSPRRFAPRLGLVRGHWPLWAWLAAAAATPMVGLMTAMIFGLFLTESEAIRETSQMFRQLGTTGFMIPLAVMIGGMPAICEELLFRGYIQTRLTRRWGAVAGLLVASAVFAIFHLDPVHALTVFPIGLWLGWLSLRSGSIVPAMIAHLINNVLAVFSIVLAPEEVGQMPTVAAVLAVLMVLAAGGLGLTGVAAAAFFFPPPPTTSSVTNPALATSPEPAAFDSPPPGVFPPEAR